MGKKIRIGALISGGGSNLQAIMDACEKGKIPGEVVFAGADNPDAKGLIRAEKKGIFSFVVDYRAIETEYMKNPENFTPPCDFSIEKILTRQSLVTLSAKTGKTRRFFMTRAVAEAMIMEKIKNIPFDLIVLAGFMRKLTPYFIDRINKKGELPRIMNIHPAILPSFPGVDGYKDTFEYGCKVGGCTVHFIDYGEDTGPIIGQRAFPIEPSDSLDDVKKKGLALEWELYPQCIKLFAQNRLEILYGTALGKKRAVVRIK